MTKPTKWLCAQQRLRSAWVTQWVAKDPSLLHADSEDSDQTGRRPRLIWVFAGSTVIFIGFVMRWLIYMIVLKINLTYRISPILSLFWFGFLSFHYFGLILYTASLLFASLQKKNRKKLCTFTTSNCIQSFPHICLFVLRLNIPVNNFSVMSGRSHRFLGN